MALAKLTVVILLGLGAIGTNLHAAEERGNGGDAVVCRSEGGEIITAELYDFFEGRERWSLQPSLGNANLDPVAKVQIALTRLAAFDGHRSSRYQNRLLEFFDNARFVSSGLDDIPDHGDFVLDPGCEVEQVAIGREPQFPHDRTFLIARPIWDAMDHDNRAGLILHEIVLEEAKSIGHVDSVRARYLNVLVSSEEFQQHDQRYYDQTLSDLYLANNQLIHHDRGDTDVYTFFDLEKERMDAHQYCVDRRLGGVFMRFEDVIFSYRTYEDFRKTPFAETIGSRRTWAGAMHSDAVPPPHLVPASIRIDLGEFYETDPSMELPFICKGFADLNF